MKKKTATTSSMARLAFGVASVSTSIGKIDMHIQEGAKTSENYSTVRGAFCHFAFVHMCSCRTYMRSNSNIEAPNKFDMLKV